MDSAHYPYDAAPGRPGPSVVPTSPTANWRSTTFSPKHKQKTPQFYDHDLWVAVTFEFYQLAVRSVVPQTSAAYRITSFLLGGFSIAWALLAESCDSLKGMHCGHVPASQEPTSLVPLKFPNSRPFPHHYSSPPRCNLRQTYIPNEQETLRALFPCPAPPRTPSLAFRLVILWLPAGRELGFIALWSQARSSRHWYLFPELPAPLFGLMVSSTDSHHWCQFLPPSFITFLHLPHPFLHHLFFPPQN